MWIAYVNRVKIVNIHLKGTGSKDGKIVNIHLKGNGSKDWKIVNIHLKGTGTFLPFDYFNPDCNCVQLTCEGSCV